jgi:hypothetical protein
MKESIIKTRYEVLSKDGGGNWNKLSEHHTIEEADAALKKYTFFHGIRIDRVECVTVMSVER